MPRHNEMCYFVISCMYCHTEKPDIATLVNLSTSEGDIKIIQRSARQYREIGIILLNDRYGERVEAIEHDKRGQEEAIMLTIYKTWLAEDTNCSWVTLTDCFRQCGLDHLAYSIEQHFGLPTPKQHSQGWTSTISKIRAYSLAQTPRSQVENGSGNYNTFLGPDLQSEYRMAAYDQTLANQGLPPAQTTPTHMKKICRTKFCVDSYQTLLPLCGWSS